MIRLGHSVNEAKVIQVIETVSRIGKGTEEDPCRLVTEYWSLDGELLAVNDHWKTAKD